MGLRIFKQSSNNSKMVNLQGEIWFGGIYMEIPIIDEERLLRVKELIHKAALLMEEDYDKHQEEVEALGRQVEALAGKTVDIFEANCYWSHSSLDDVAKSFLMPEPEQCDLTNDEIKDILVHFFDYLGQYGDAVSDYIVEFLALNTGLSNMMDYIYFSEEVGLELEPSMGLEECMSLIADKIIEDRRSLLR